MATKTRKATAPKIALARFSKKHHAATRRWINDPEITHFTGTVFPVSEHEHEVWTQRLQANPTVRFFAVESGGAHIGNAGVFHYDEEIRTARLFVYIGDKTYWGSGAGTQATRLVCDYCFRTLGALRVEATVFSYNPRAKSSYLKAGFREEARLRGAHFHGGKHHDMLLLGLLASEWKGVS